MTTDEELAQIMAALNGPSLFPQLCAIAEQYTKEKLSPDELCPKPANGTQTITLSSTQTIIASLFIYACRDVLIRDSKPKADDYQADGKTLRAALEVLQREALL